MFSTSSVYFCVVVSKMNALGIVNEGWVMHKLSAIKTYLEITSPSWIKADNYDYYAKIRAMGEKYIRDRNHEAGIAAESKPMIGKVPLKSILKNCLVANRNEGSNDAHRAIEAGNTIVMDYHCCGRGSEMQYLTKIR